MIVAHMLEDDGNEVRVVPFAVLEGIVQRSARAWNAEDENCCAAAAAGARSCRGPIPLLLLPPESDRATHR